MTTPVYANRVIETSSNTPASSGTVTVNLSGTSPTLTFVGGGTTAGSTFVSQFANGAKVRVHIFETAAPTRWAFVAATFNTGSPNTLTFVAADVRDGSSGAGAIPTWAGTVTASIEGAAIDLWRSHLAARAHVEGGKLVYNSTTVLDIEACTLAINGKVLSTTSTTTLTSGSTMKDLANSTVTLGASKAYFVFAYDNAGTLEFRIEERDGTGDGADPTFDTDYDYWKAASTGVAARRIGKFWVGSGGFIVPFKMNVIGLRYREVVCVTAAAALVSGGTSTTYASVTITPWHTADDEEMILRLSNTKTVSTGFMELDMSLDSGTNTAGLISMGNQTSGSVGTVPPTPYPYTGTLHYKVFSNSTGTIQALGFGFRI